MQTPGGSYAEYGVAPAHTTALLPPSSSFEEGATIPLAALTAVVGLYAADRLGLPQPWVKATKSSPLLVYGAASAVGSFAIQLAQKRNIHPIIAVAGKAQAHVEALIDRSKGDTIVDYRNGNEAVVQGIRDALKGAKLEHAFDCVSEKEKGSPGNIAQVLDPQTGKVTFVLPDASKGITMAPSEKTLFDGYSDSVKRSFTGVGGVHEDQKDLGYVYMRYFSRGLAEGWFKAHPQEVIPGGLGGIQQGLENLKNGKASAVKYVFRVSETEGAGSGK
ncbi:Trans-enoyl reductase fsr4 [Fulvia fulva]|uniref:Trans-enoyl reductase fsr4 n=1 Tax=Passalora fulva TaxID=5499 RepID=A0A9Q8LHK6_PASFU|nr:Trans-enoyl reductase fsr4 [Fulvia fulva]KAK4624630.1 Trans-enoyl reductase fsr4 [Fulvia fulva]KAK4625292.1 Trans-enoyl reductase fsr4 [Fulvia fulva]UJO17572.1 Trans-enoyl reductase fsr4 [Fulvia fulva]WPV15179.1 Trans-enoyl reductase fsr4 [Fulvia fulva]WPV30336.1 Trans-enoyl reductase fsr4 [Fulvia fulva]